MVQFGGVVWSDGSFEIGGGDRSRTYVGSSYLEVDEAWGEILKGKQLANDTGGEDIFN